MIKLDSIVSFLDSYLDISAIEDSSCNGLQVEGYETVTRVGLAVDGCLETFEKAVEMNCQMILVHHGIIWGGGLRCLRGNVLRQIRFLIDNGISLYAAHLPLDLHPQSGNNISIALMLKLKCIEPFGNYHGSAIGYSGELEHPANLHQIAQLLENSLGGSTTLIPFGSEMIRTVGIVSGGGSDCLHEAVEKRLDCVITGEPQHWNYHFARENTINIIYAGHYHTEQHGVQKIGDLLKREFGVATEFLNLPTPI